ncbi:ARID-like protein [Atractiella rhizophila]|nr:ARID-like protein [Atractiella rhizophila]
MSSLRTQSPIPRGYDEASRKERIFGLERGPTFYPTAEEWADPMAYIQRLAKPVGEEGGLGAAEYGIAKIVPPQGWQMTWDMDTEVLQTLNSMEACARANLNFMEQLYIFHKQQGSPHSKITVPQINHRPVDLWRLRKEVHSQGGYQAITQARKWPSVAKSLGYDVRNVPSVSSQLKTAFQRIILPFDEFMANSPSSSSATSTNPSITPKPAARSNLIVKEESLETPKVMERVKEATKRLEEALNTESGMEVEEEVPPGEVRHSISSLISNNRIELWVTLGWIAMRGLRNG